MIDEERGATTAGEARRIPPPPSPKKEEEESEHRASPSGKVVHLAVLREGDEELRRTSAELGWSGLAAGLSMGFSFLAEALLDHHLPDAGWAPLVSKLGYGVGFLIVVLGRQQLFTENTLTAVLPLFARRDARTFANLLRLWTVVLLTNLAGTMLLAWGIAALDVFDPPVHETLAKVAREATAPGAGALFLRGIFAGWLIALMVWLLPAAETARIWIVLLLTYLIGLGGFPHVIVGSVEAAYLVAAGIASWGEYLRFLLPTLAGNIVGGVLLVAGLAHAQHARGLANRAG